MSTVTQRIPNLLSGISQQPDNRKFPGQLKDSVNAFPDYALGLLKRPGGQYVNELYGATPEGKWFSILRDPQEKYVAQYDDYTFRIWSLIDSALGEAGSPRAVDMGSNTGVPGTCKLEDILSITNAGSGLTDGTFTDLATATTESGTGLTVDLVIASGVVTTVTINQSGSGYADGDTITMSDTGTYPSVEFSYDEGLKTRLATYNDAVEDTAAKLALLHVAQADYAEVLAGQDSTETSLFEVTYNYPVGDINQILKSGILETASGNYIVKNNNTVVSTLTTLPANYALGTEFTDEYPLLAAEGYRVYQAILTVAATHTSDDLDTALPAMNAAQTNYDNAVTTEATAKTNYDAEVTNCSITATPSDGYLYGATADDIELLTLNDYTFVLNKAKKVALKTTLSETQPYQAFVVIKLLGSGHYKIFLDGVERASYNAGSGTDIDALLDFLVTLIDGFTFAGKTYSATAVGYGIYISCDHEFNISTVGGPSENAMFVFQDSTPTVADLPLQCRDDYVVKVTNSEDVNADDMYVKFITDGFTPIEATYSRTGTTVTVTTSDLHGIADGQEVYLNFTSGDATSGYYEITKTNNYEFTVVDTASGTTSGDVTISKGLYGPGVWEETIAPGIKYEFDPLTLPHQLVRNTDGSFTYGPIDWADRLVGDETTNPDPSFVGQKINNIFFYRNRLGFLSNEAVILSRAGDYFNFWATTALTVTDDDPIDVIASSIRPVNLRYVHPTSVGLVLFSDTEQFILTTDADIFSPNTIKLNQLSAYECDSSVEAVGLGLSIGFISKTPLYTRLYEISNISKDIPPNILEPTQIVPELIPQTIDNMIASPALSLISMGTTGSKTVYQYKFFQGREQRASAWYKWDLTGTLLDQFFDNNIYYATIKSGTNVYVQSFDLTQASEEGFLTLPTGEKTDVCLDFWNTNPYRTYDSSADTTRIFLPYDSVSGGTLSVVVLGGYIGDDAGTTSASVGAVLYPTVEGTTGAYYADIDGDYRGRNLIIGYLYTMEVELPQFFVTQSDGQTAVTDFTSDLIIHRIKVSTGLSGPVKYQITITGRPEWSNTIEAVAPYDYTLNNVNMAADAVHNVPIYQRNENLNLKIIGDSPFPVSLLSLNWEGKYNTGFYRRAN